MDAIVFDEVARLYPANVSSELENQARIDIINWLYGHSHAYDWDGYERRH